MALNKNDKKRPKGMPRWKWREQLDKEKLNNFEKESSALSARRELNKSLEVEGQGKTSLPIWLDNILTRLLAGNLVLGLIFVPILIIVIIAFLALLGFVESLF